MPTISPTSNTELFAAGRRRPAAKCKIVDRLRKKVLAILRAQWYHNTVSITVFAEWVPTHSFLRDFLTMYAKVRRT